jgi:hypothetical protein
VATFPTFETVLLHIAKALGAANSMPSKSKTKFKNVDMSLANLFDTWKKILGDISDALGLDESAKNDLISNIEKDYQMHKTIELNVYSSKATQRKITWHYLARVLIPVLARHTVFWQITSKLDAGMPGGKFWYLPFSDPSYDTKEVQLPVQQVLNWLIDLIQQPNVSIAKNIEEDLRIYGGSGTVLKNLYNWKKAKSTPEISSINNTFPDEVKLNFEGCFTPNDKSSHFEQALCFINSKGLTPQALQHEIDFTEDELNLILNTDCTIEVQDIFVAELKVRYQAPYPSVIRKRLLIARATQEGYEQLVKFLTPNVDKHCIDLNLNKTLQLVKLYGDIYNLTLKAHSECSHLREHAENQYFTKMLPPYLRYDLLLCVASENHPTVPLVPDRLNSIFSRAGEHDNLDNLFPISDDDIEEMTNVLKNEAHHAKNHQNQLNILVEKLRQNKTPFKQLQKNDDFDVVLEALSYNYSNKSIKNQILQRLIELENTPTQSMRRIIVELNDKLNHQIYNSKTESDVSKLIAEAKRSVEFDYWKAMILQLEAVHFIAQNKLHDAEKNLNLAIEECKNNSFGNLRGILAKDAFSLAIANQKLIPNNHEKYFRDMINWDCLESHRGKSKSIDIFNVSRELHEYFWTDLYKCYPTYTPLFSSSKLEFQSFIIDLEPYINNRTPIEHVLKKHNALRNKQLKHPQSDSVILLLLKSSYEMLTKLRYFKGSVPLKEGSEIKAIFQGFIDAVREIIKTWPEIVNLSDFKQQTPLMLAAHNNDYETVEVLLKANADPNLQDIKGRTALHAAAASRCLPSALLLINNGVDAKITTREGATALHTAVRVGEIPITKLLIEKRPELLLIEDFQGILPEQLARKITEDRFLYEYLTSFLLSENRQVVNHDTYKTLLKSF